MGEGSPVRSPDDSAGLTRRALLASGAALPLAACTRHDAATYDGGWIGANAERGHRLRDARAGALPVPAAQRRASVLIVGAGVAGLTAARALMQRGVDDVHVLDLEDVAGGNSRGHAIAGMACPLGAHYLPVPDDDAVEVIELLESLGLRRIENGVAVYDERHLCHSPQERLHIGGAWHDGLLPPVEALPERERANTLAQYRRYAALVERASRVRAYTLPTARSAWTAEHTALDAQTFATWLDAQGLDAAALRWYLDYCCRDDYGAGAAQVSAWAGLHYFASRHGFHAPGDASAERDGVLTWPEGNAWLSRRLAEPLGARVHPAQIALRVVEARDAVGVDVWDARAQRIERWTASQVILAVPLFIAARLLEAPPAALTQAAAAMRHAPWLVGNLHLAEALDDRPGAPPSWDNVVYDAGAALPTLGYVDAMHQSTRSLPGPTVLTTYWALGGNTPGELAQQRARLLGEPWAVWAEAILQGLAPVHPDLRAKLRRVDLMRYGHAMSIPVPGLRSGAALAALAAPQRRVHYAHADLSAYSVFEESAYHGARAAVQVRAAFERAPLNRAG